MAGFKNTGVLGTEDGSHDFFSAEIKSCLKFTGEEFMEQCVRNAPAGKVPIVIVHIMGRKHKDDLVMFRFQDLPKILNKGISGTG